MRYDIKSKSNENGHGYFGRQAKLVACPFEVRIDGVLHDHFYDIRDAAANARAARKNHPMAAIVIMDARSGKLVLELD